MEQREEQERMRAEDPEAMKQEIREIGTALDNLLGKENYVVDREGKVTYTQNDLLGEKETNVMKDLERRLKEAYANLKRINERKK